MITSMTAVMLLTSPLLRFRFHHRFMTITKGIFFSWKTFDINENINCCALLVDSLTVFETVHLEKEVVIV